MLSSPAQEIGIGDPKKGVRSFDSDPSSESGRNHWRIELFLLTSSHQGFPHEGSYSPCSNSQNRTGRIQDEREDTGNSHLHVQVRSLTNAKNEEVYRVLFDMPENLVMSVAHCDESSWIAEVPCLFWDDTVQSRIKMSLNLGEAIPDGVPHPRG